MKTLRLVFLLLASRRLWTRVRMALRTLASESIVFRRASGRSRPLSKHLPFSQRWTYGHMCVRPDHKLPRPDGTYFKEENLHFSSRQSGTPTPFLVFPSRFFIVKIKLASNLPCVCATCNKISKVQN